MTAQSGPGVPSEDMEYEVQIFIRIRRTYLAARPHQELVSDSLQTYLGKYFKVGNTTVLREFSKKLWLWTEGKEPHPPTRYRLEFAKKWIKKVVTSSCF